MTNPTLITKRQAERAQARVGARRAARLACREAMKALKQAQSKALLSVMHARLGRALLAVAEAMMPLQKVLDDEAEVRRAVRNRRAARKTLDAIGRIPTTKGDKV